MTRAPWNWLRRRRGSWIMRSALGVMALGLFGTPFALTWYPPGQLTHARGGSAAPGGGPSVAHIDPAQVRQWRLAAANLPANAPPVVLAYHDIRPGATDKYTVTPAALDAQLTALEAAGYQTITSAQYVAWVQGGPVPPRSVYITFDDGTDGLWAYGTAVLARHHAHGASYLITGRVGTHPPYYLTWPEVIAMARSGNWDFQAHTHNLHSRAPIDASGKTGSMLTNRLWLAAQHRLETPDEYQARVTADTNTIFADFAAHGLPKPQLFAYPFSELIDPSGDATPTRFTQDLLAHQFVATFTNKTRTPAPSSRRSSDARLIGRLEVTSTSTADSVLERVMSWTQQGVDGQRPLDDPTRWRDWDNNPLHTLAPFTGSGPAPDYSYAVYQPFASADWDDYQVAMDVRGLVTNRPGVNLQVRIGGSTPLAIRFARSTVEVRGTGKGAPLITRANVRAAAGHRVTVAVTGTATVVTVDGQQVLRLPAQGPAVSGGIALAVSQGDRSQDHPGVAAMSLAPIRA
ncbi:MAG TPA: polysaccharide deacetylase family protein [Rugosimonospora sp.]|nr:polysaccharide deacetylase family protein [Rugosimonospora sp.]